MQSQLQLQIKTPHVQEEEIQISKFLIKGINILDNEVVSRVNEFGYPKKFIEESVRHLEMNDASACYFLMEKDKFQQNTGSPL